MWTFELLTLTETKFYFSKYLINLVLSGIKAFNADKVLSRIYLIEPFCTRITFFPPCILPEVVSVKKRFYMLFELKLLYVLFSKSKDLEFSWNCFKQSFGTLTFKMGCKPQIFSALERIYLKCLHQNKN